MNPSLIYLALALFVWGIGEGMFYVFQPIYLQQLGADPLQIGAILGASGIAMMIAHIPAGYLADRIGRRPLLITAWSIGTFATLLMALAPGLTVFTIGLLFYGATAFVSSPLSSYATAARGKWTIERTLTLVTASFSAGIVIGPLTGGWIGDHLGIRTIYGISTGLFVLSTIFLLFIRHQPPSEQDPSAPPAGLLTNKRYLGFLLIAFLVTFALYLPQPLTANFLQNQRGLSLSLIGLFGTIGGLGNVILALRLGRFEARVGFLLGQLGVLCFALLIWLGTGPLFFGLAYFLLGGFRAVRSLTTAQIRPLIHESQMGLGFGIAESIFSLPIVLTPPLAGYIYSYQPDLVYPVAMALILFGLAISYLFTSRLQPETTPA